MDELKELKKILDSHRLSNPKLKNFPDHFWPRVIHASKQIPRNQIAKFLNINLGNLNRRIKEASSSDHLIKKSMPQQFLQIPIESSGPTGKQIVLTLPHNITIRIEV